MTTYTPIARLPIMTPADPAVKNAWGAIVNAAFSAIEQVAAGITTADLTGLTAYTLTVANDAPDQARQAMIFFTGAPTGPCTVTIPSVARMGWVCNRSTQPVILATATAVTNLTIPVGFSFLYTCDGAAVAAVTINPAALLNAPAGVLIGNGTAYLANDPSGVARLLMSIGTDNQTDLFMGGAAKWRVLNQAGTVELFSILPGGAAGFAGTTTFAEGVVAQGVDAGGLNYRLVGGAFGSGWLNDGTNTYLLLTFPNAQLGSPNAFRPITVVNTNGKVLIDGTGAGVTFGGNITAGGVFGTNGGIIGGVTFSGGSLSATAQIAAVGTVSGSSFVATSDARLKSGIADITPQEAYDWIGSARPRTYTMDGRFQAGFVAQEEVDNGRQAAVVSIPDTREMFAESDGYAPAGHRLARRYEHDVAYLTKALQGALARIGVLEAQARGG